MVFTISQVQDFEQLRDKINGGADLNEIDLVFDHTFMNNLCEHGFKEFKSLINAIALQRRNNKHFHSVDFSFCEKIPNQFFRFFVRVPCVNFMGCTQISNTTVEAFGYKGVREISLSNCSHIRNASIQSLGGVETIDLSGCLQITDETIEFLGRCDVKNIVLVSCGITDRALSALRNASHVNLKLCQNITDAGIAELCNVPSLVLSRNSKITNAGVKKLKGAVYLDLSACEHVTIEGVDGLMEGCLRSLDLSENSNIHNEHLKILANSHLREIYLDGCPITNEGLRFFEHTRNIVMVSLADCNVTDAGMEYLAGIQEISLAGCNVTDAGVRCLVGVQRINLNYCRHITNAGIRSLKDVQEIFVDGCPNITKDFH